jgi:hypothetical protein
MRVKPDTTDRSSVPHPGPRDRQMRALADAQTGAPMATGAPTILRDRVGRRFYPAAVVERVAAERERLACATREASGG